MLRLESLNRTVRNLFLVTDFIKSMGANTETVFDIEDNFIGSPQMQACLNRVKEIPEARTMMEERYTTGNFDLETLSRLPYGTLGHTYANIMKALGYDPNFYRHRNVLTDEDWLIDRSRKCHDLIHIVTGFGPTGGEIGVLSLQSVQIGSPLNVYLQISSLALSFKRQPENLRKITDQMARGMAMGLQAKPLIAQKWEEGWDKPLSEWRKELNILDPVIDEPYSLKNRLPDLDVAW